MNRASKLVLALAAATLSAPGKGSAGDFEPDYLAALRNFANGQGKTYIQPLQQYVTECPPEWRFLPDILLDPFVESGTHQYLIGIQFGWKTYQPHLAMPHLCAQLTLPESRFLTREQFGLLLQVSSAGVRETTDRWELKREAHLPKAPEDAASGVPPAPGVSEVPEVILGEDPSGQ